MLLLVWRDFICERASPIIAVTVGLRISVGPRGEVAVEGDFARSLFALGSGSRKGIFELATPCEIFLAGRKSLPFPTSLLLESPKSADATVATPFAAAATATRGLLQTPRGTVVAGDARAAVGGELEAGEEAVELVVALAMGIAVAGDAAVSGEAAGLTGEAGALANFAELVGGALTWSVVLGPLHVLLPSAGLARGGGLSASATIS